MAFGDGTFLEIFFENWDKVMELMECFGLGEPKEVTAAAIVDGSISKGKLRRLHRRIRRHSPVVEESLITLLRRDERTPYKRRKIRKRLRNEAASLSNDDCNFILLKWANEVLAA